MYAIRSYYGYMLFFGFIRDYKGLDILLEAITNKWFEKNKIKLIVAGEFYNNPEKYHKFIEENQLKDSLILHNDFISNEKVNLYFSAADIVVQPYKSATQSGVTQIGYHFNKPMLVTNVGRITSYNVCYTKLLRGKNRQTSRQQRFGYISYGYRRIVCPCQQRFGY